MHKITLLLLLILGSAQNLLHAQGPVWVQKAHPDGLQVNGVIFSDDGQSVLSGTNCHPAKIRRFDVTNGEITWDYTVAISLECMMGVALSSNNQYFATAEETGHLMLFDYTQNPPTLAQTIDLSTSYAFAVDFAPNSSRVIVGCSNGKLKAFDLPGGTEAWSITAHPLWVTCVAYAADNTKIATGGNDNKVKLWDANGNLLFTLNGHTDDITSVKFTPDNQKLLSCGRDKKLRVWDVNTGTLLQTLSVSTKTVNAMDLSADGAYVVTAADTLLQIWRMSDLSPVGAFSTSEWDIPMAVSWSPTSNHIFCGTSNGTVALFDASSTVKNTETPSFKMRVFPNPASTNIQIEWPVNEQISKVELYNLAGNLLWYQDILSGANQWNIQLPETLPAGNLVVKLTALDGRSAQQVIQKQ